MKQRQIRIDLNVDIGEGFPYDDELLVFATSANICCGAHAGSWALTRETIGKALENNVRIGIHPGYPDRIGMGRKSPPVAELNSSLDSIRAQVEQFFNFVPAAYIKPHGALYSDSQDISHPSFLVLQEICSTFQLPLLGFPGTAHESISSNFLIEGFPDRRLNNEGRLMSRTLPGAVLESSAEIGQQALELGKSVDSLCLHGDNPGCVAHAAEVVRRLLEAGYEVGC